jgi:hypothetical protein
MAWIRRALALGLLLATGCITHLPPPVQHKQMHIGWTRDFDEAQQRAAREGKPVLAVLAAGELDGLC